MFLFFEHLVSSWSSFHLNVLVKYSHGFLSRKISICSIAFWWLAPQVPVNMKINIFMKLIPLWNRKVYWKRYLVSTKLMFTDIVAFGKNSLFIMVNSGSLVYDVLWHLFTQTGWLCPINKNVITVSCRTVWYYAQVFWGIV